MPSARVVVIIPVYNGALTVSRCLQSVSDQTYSDLVVVVDDGSTDGSAAIARSHVGLAGRISVVQQQNAGPGAARNTGVISSESEFVAMLDADDAWASTRLERCVELLERDGDLVFVSTTATVGDEEGRVLDSLIGDELASVPPDRVLSAMAERNLAFGSCVVRRSALEAVGGVSPDRVLIGAEDYDVWLRLLMLPGARAMSICEPLARYTRRPEGLSLSDPARNERARLEVLRRHALALAKRGAYCRPGDAVEVALTSLGHGRVLESLRFLWLARCGVKRKGGSFGRLFIGRARRRLRDW